MEPVVETLMREIAEKVASCDFVKGVVLGGSRATGTAHRNSDLDIGIYYEKEKIDFRVLNAIARELDDTHRENLICEEGGWGNWVNCGGWLTIKGVPVDLILRDIRRVKLAIKQTNRGEISVHYQPGHPHAYLNVMYRGELALSRLLLTDSQEFADLKQQAEFYPETLRKSLISFFLFESGFSCELAEHYGKDGDLYYLVGHLFRSVSSLNQVLFALNRTYCLNEKKALLRLKELKMTPPDYCERVNSLFSLSSQTVEESIWQLKKLCADVGDLVDY